MTNFATPAFAAQIHYDYISQYDPDRPLTHAYCSDLFRELKANYEQQLRDKGESRNADDPNIQAFSQLKSLCDNAVGIKPDPANPGMFREVTIREWTSVIRSALESLPSE